MNNYKNNYIVCKNFIFSFHDLYQDENNLNIVKEYQKIENNSTIINDEFKIVNNDSEFSDDGYETTIIDEPDIIYDNFNNYIVDTLKKLV